MFAVSDRLSTVTTVFGAQYGTYSQMLLGCNGKGRESAHPLYNQPQMLSCSSQTPKVTQLSSNFSPLHVIRGIYTEAKYELGESDATRLNKFFQRQNGYCLRV